MSQPLNWSLLKQIAVFRALPGLGDFLCVTPALRALRLAAPQAQIVLIGLPAMRGLSDRLRLVDEFVDFPGYPGLPEQSPDPQALAEFLTNMQHRQFDLALQMHGSGGVTNPVTIALGAHQTAGFFIQNCPDPDFFLPFQESESEVKRYLRLMEFLNVPLQGDALEFPVTEADWQNLQTFKADECNQYVCIHPGASIADRRWSIANFAEIGDAIAQMGLQIVLTGSLAEVDLAEAVIKQMQAPAVNLAGRTSLGTLAALLSRAKLLICNDTGVSHLAAALRVPSVIVFTRSDPQRWAPLDLARHRPVQNPNGVSVAAVLEPAKKLLQEAAYAAR